MGQSPFEWQPPNGYPDVMGAWANTNALLARWNLLQLFVTGSRNGVHTRRGIQIDFLSLLGSPQPQTAKELVNKMAQRLLLQDVSAEDQSHLLSYVGLQPQDTITENDLKQKAAQVAALLINSPYFQFR
jgi:hypothetical protein